MKDEIIYNSVYLDKLIENLNATFHDDFLTLYPWEEELSKQEIDLLFGIIGLVNNHYGKLIKVDYGVIKAICGRRLGEKPHITSKFINKLIDKLRCVHVPLKTKAPLFSIKNNQAEKEIMVKVGGPSYNYLFNDLNSNNSTTVNLRTLRGLNTANGKDLYILLSSYRKSGEVILPINELRGILHTSRTTTYSDRLFTSRVFTPAIDDVINNGDFNVNYELVKDLNNEVIDVIFKLEVVGENIDKIESNDIEVVTYEYLDFIDTLDEVNPTFHNDLFDVYPWTESISIGEMNLLFGMIALLNNNEGDLISIDYGLVRLLANRNIGERPATTKLFINNAIEKLSSIQVNKNNSEGLFSIRHNPDERNIQFKVSDREYLYLFNNLNDNFTSVNLMNLHLLDNSNAKKLYILASRYKNCGSVKVPIVEVRSILNTNFTREYSDNEFYTRVIEKGIEIIEDTPLVNFNFNGKCIRDYNNRIKYIEFTSTITHSIEKEGDTINLTIKIN